MNVDYTGNERTNKRITRISGWCHAGGDEDDEGVGSSSTAGSSRTLWWCTSAECLKRGTFEAQYLQIINKLLLQQTENVPTTFTNVL